MSVTGAIYTSMSGLAGFTKALDNTSNNVANMNTPGYKGRDLFFQELTAFPDGQGERQSLSDPFEGGGVKVAGSSIRFGEGDISATANNTDLAISGNGFFVLRNEDNELFFTRAGQFRLNEDNVFVDPDTGFRVAALNSDGSLVDIDFSSLLQSASQVTTSASIDGNLDAGTAVGATVSGSSSASPLELKIVGANGEVQTLRTVFTRGLGTQWSLQLTDVAGNPVVAPHSIAFADDGAIRADSAQFSTTYQPFTVLTPTQMSTSFTTPPTFAFTDGNPTTAPAQAFALTGEPYFVLRNSGTPNFVHTASLAFDATGFLIDSATQNRVAAVGTNGVLTDFALGTLTENPAQATTKVILEGNLDPASTVSTILPPQGTPLQATVIRPDGSQFVLTFNFTKTADNVWSMQAQDSNGLAIGSASTVNFTAAGVLNTNSLAFTLAVPRADTGTFNVSIALSESTSRRLSQQSGSTAALSGVASDGVTTGLLQSLTFNNEGIAQLTYSNGRTATGPRLAAVNRGNELSVPLTINLEGLRSASGGNSLAVDSIDGRATGGLTEFVFDAAGSVKLTYSNGVTETGPQIALAQFSNLNALTPVGAAMFTATDEAGLSLGKPNQSGFGELKGSSLELSNVELSREFADIIIIQRGYQASSQVMNVTNEMVKQLYDSVRGAG